MDKIAIVGAQSVIGLHLATRLRQHYRVVTIARRGSGDGNEVVVADYGEIPPEAFTGCKTVINCVGLVNARSQSEYWHVNVQLLERIAKAAKASGVHHFVHLSSLSVYGDNEYVTNDSREAPASLYGRSKLAGDRALMPLADSNFEITLVRPPIVYSSTIGGKIAQLARLMSRLRFFVKSIPPVRRSVIHIENLVTTIEMLLRNPVSAPVLVADEGIMTVPELAGMVANVTGKRIWLLPLPRWCCFPIKLFAPSIYGSLFRSSVVDSTNLPASGAQSSYVPLDTGLHELVSHTLQN